MSTTSEIILKSLADLEKNLKEIDSAKLQVSKVVKSSDDLAKVIETYQSSFDGVLKNLKTVISEIKSVNLDTISALSVRTELFNKEVTRLIEFDFTNSFDSIESKVIEQFEKDLKEQLDDLDNKALDLQSKINEFKVQISRIEKVDLESHFNNVLTILTNQSDKQNIELSKKYDEVINKSDNIIFRLGKQEKETKSLKTLLLVTIGIMIIGIVITLVMK